VQLAYDAHARLETVTQGMRILTRGYGIDGFLESVIDPLTQPWAFTPDAVGRALAETRPDGEEVLLTYDQAGNNLSVTPPTQPSHLFALLGHVRARRGGLAAPRPEAGRMVPFALLGRPIRPAEEEDGRGRGPGRRRPRQRRRRQAGRQVS